METKFIRNKPHLLSPVAVVWCGPDRENSVIEVPLVSFHHQLMGATDQVYAVGRVELGYHVTPKQVSRSPRAHSPALRVYKGRGRRVKHNCVKSIEREQLVCCVSFISIIFLRGGCQLHCPELAKH